MASVIYNEGAATIIETYFGGTLAAPTAFYIGLGTGGVNPDRNAGLVDIQEVDGVGYERIEILPEEWTIAGNEIISPALEWTNYSQTDAWAPVDYAFITLSATGTDEPAILIAAADLRDSVIVMPQRTARIVVRFHL